jgi:hypothetical protein
VPPPSHLLAVSGALADTGVLSGSVASAAVAAEQVDETFFACVNVPTGVMRLIEPLAGRVCTGDPDPGQQRQIFWAKPGARGPEGPAGARGSRARSRPPRRPGTGSGAAVATDPPAQAGPPPGTAAAARPPTAARSRTGPRLHRSASHRAPRTPPDSGIPPTPARPRPPTRTLDPEPSAQDHDRRSASSITRERSVKDALSPYIDTGHGPDLRVSPGGPPAVAGAGVPAAGLGDIGRSAAVPLDVVHGRNPAAGALPPLSPASRGCRW